MNILITGVTGFVGSNLYKYLKKNRFLVWGISRSASDDEFIRKVDLINKSKVKNEFEKINPDIIIHTAAVLPQSYCNDEGKVAAELNNMIDLNVVNYCEYNSVHLIYFSSAYIYNRSIGDAEITESDNIMTVGPYLQQKFNSEKLIKKKLLNYTILRMSSPFGEGLKKKVVLNKFIEKASRNKPITLYGRGERIQNFVYIKDIVSILKRIVENPMRGVYNLVGDTSISMSNLAEIIIYVTNSSSKIIYKADKLDVCDNNRFSNAKIKMDFKGNCSYNIEQALKDYI